MAHLLAPQLSDPGLPVFFNVEGVVGSAPAQNKREDVLLVQFIFKVIANSPITTNPQLLAVTRAVKVTGIIDQATIDAIRYWQELDKRKQFSGAVDGRVSPARGGYSHGNSFWTIISLNTNLKFRFDDIWPRIDKIPGCPDELKRMVVRVLTGVALPG